MASKGFEGFKSLLSKGILRLLMFSKDLFLNKTIPKVFRSLKKPSEVFRNNAKRSPKPSKGILRLLMSSKDLFLTKTIPKVFRSLKKPSEVFRNNAKRCPKPSKGF